MWMFIFLDHNFICFLKQISHFPQIKKKKILLCWNLNLKGTFKKIFTFSFLDFNIQDFNMPDSKKDFSSCSNDLLWISEVKYRVCMYDHK